MLLSKIFSLIYFHHHFQFSVISFILMVLASIFSPKNDIIIKFSPIFQIFLRSSSNFYYFLYYLGLFLSIGMFVLYFSNKSCQKISFFQYLVYFSSSQIISHTLFFLFQWKNFLIFLHSIPLII